MAPDPAAMKRRRWWIAGATIGGMLLLFVTVFFCWLFSTADLDAVDARARCLGLPANFDEANLPLSPPEDLAKWDAVVAALAKCPRWDPFNIPGWKGPRVGEPIPDGVRTHLAAKKVELEILISAVEALPEGGVWLRDRVGVNTKQYEIRPAIEVIGVLCDALLLHGTELEAGERLLRAARVVPSGNPGAEEYYIRNYLVSQVIHALLWVGFKGEERERIVSDCEKLRIFLQGRLWCQSEYLCQRAYQSELGLNGEAFCRFLAQPSYVAYKGSPSEWAIASVDLRFHRAIFLEEIQDLSVEFSRKPLLGIYMRNENRSESQSVMRYSRLNELWPTISVATISQLSLHFRLAVLHSELTGEPWPVDPFDAKGGPVRQLVKDGQLIGVYSIGENQIDDHGDQNLDIVLKLRPRPAPVDVKPPGGR